ncbi:MAG: methylated-DNA--[protein]-cysteine S-methyltransferase [Gemmatales bacterium]|nr:methylated-DNA--[protein]-cysteine S-methyltransferase [Gemmatales bacterium]MCS7160531.1 methylated-DNA--[protein]-cysteine S-methyltransferase [Gemmatales bacterium]MDW8175732.1 methylated-DNA--[protein]-cysteine S-methyltransferase [Gemmatales bacterium]MDW8223769.1 methylated-DNA--[protein]-cysteine S-methyltransferase [Gemmatales bacterium]
MPVDFTHAGYFWSSNPCLYDPESLRDQRYYYFLPNPFGLLQLCWTSGGLQSVCWCEREPRLAPATVLFPRWLDRAVAYLQHYFRGGRIRLRGVPFDWSGIRPFQRQVLQACRRIPMGQTITYRDLARRIGQATAVRAVARALAANPWTILIPCHRVIRHDGSLGGYSAPGGTSLKQKLLAFEYQACRQASMSTSGRPARFLQPHYLAS